MDIYELTERDLRSWDDAMADDTPVPSLPLTFWFMLDKFDQPLARAAA